MRFSCALLRVIRLMIYIDFPNSQDAKLLLAWAPPAVYSELAGVLEPPCEESCTRCL